jgi:hypothetical protein
MCLTEGKPETFRAPGAMTVGDNQETSFVGRMRTAYRRTESLATDGSGADRRVERSDNVPSGVRAVVPTANQVIGNPRSG